MARSGRAPSQKQDLPPPLPPETRTVGQLVAETIRFYARHFWRTIALGIGPAALAVGGSFLSRDGQVVLTTAGGAVVLGACFTLASALAADRPLDAQTFLRAWATAIVVWIPVPFLAIAFVIPAVAWLALAGLAIPAAVHERLPMRAALGRGLQLGRADYVHALGSLAALTIVVFLTQSVMYFLLRSGSEQAERVAIFLASLVISPILFVGAALLYDDQAARASVESGTRPESRPRPSSPRPAPCNAATPRAERSRDADVPDAVDPDRPGPPHAPVESRPATGGQPGR